jgi:lysophospholipase L1-like esterase
MPRSIRRVTAGLFAASVACGLAWLPACAQDGGGPGPAAGRQNPTSEAAGPTSASPGSVELPVFDDDPCATGSDEHDPEYDALFERWAEQEAAAPLERGRVLVIGSSSIRLWGSLNEEFSGWAPVQRGFGGAWLSEVAGAVDMLIAPHAPAAVVVFAGANDIAEGETAQRTFDAYRCLLTRIRDDVGHVPVAMITITPTPSRWDRWSEAEEFHELVIELSDDWSGLHVVDGREAFLATGEPPDEGLFLADLLHLDAEGYALWDAQVHAALDDVLGPAPRPETVVGGGDFRVEFAPSSVDLALQPPGILRIPVDGDLTPGEQWRLADAAGGAGPRLVVADWAISPTPDGSAVILRPSASAHFTLEGVEPGTEVVVTMRPADPGLEPVTRTSVADAAARAHLHLVDPEGTIVEVGGLEITIAERG